MLIVGTVLSLACAAGPTGPARLGVVPALGAALGCCWLAWREIALERRAHAAAMLATSRRHGAQLSEERRHNTAVLTAMGGRVEAFRTLAASRVATIHRLDAEIARLTGDVNGLRAANARLTRDLNLRDVATGEVREMIACRETELAALRGPDAEIHRLPNRAHRGDPAVGALDEDGAERRTAEFLDAGSVSMPNYEDDRRFA